jgi:catechol 2,3-dioxygenase-like lactoylglutathione lyase family enzyme
MSTTSIYPVLMASDVAAAGRFYTDVLGMEPVFTSDWYVSLRRGSWELAVLDAEHATIPESHCGVPARGVLVNLEVDDVDAVHERVVAAGHEIVLPLRNEDFGQRHFILAAPDGVLVDVITPIEPSAEVAAQYAG